MFVNFVCMNVQNFRYIQEETMHEEKSPVPIAELSENSLVLILSCT